MKKSIKVPSQNVGFDIKSDLSCINTPRLPAACISCRVGLNGFNEHNRYCNENMDAENKSNIYTQLFYR